MGIRICKLAAVVFLILQTEWTAEKCGIAS